MQRYWLVWEDDTPVMPERPLSMEAAIAEFRELVAQEPSVMVEIRECTAVELEWAGIHDEDS